MKKLIYAFLFLIYSGSIQAMETGSTEQLTSYCSATNFAGELKNLLIPSNLKKLNDLNPKDHAYITIKSHHPQIIENTLYNLDIIDTYFYTDHFIKDISINPDYLTNSIVLFEGTILGLKIIKESIPLDFHIGSEIDIVKGTKSCLYGSYELENNESIKLIKTKLSQIIYLLEEKLKKLNLLLQQIATTRSRDVIVDIPLIHQ